MIQKFRYLKKTEPFVKKKNCIREDFLDQNLSLRR